LQTLPNYVLERRTAYLLTQSLLEIKQLQRQIEQLQIAKVVMKKDHSVLKRLSTVEEKDEIKKLRAEIAGGSNKYRRDYVTEANGIIATKDAEIERLQARINELEGHLD